MPWLDDLIAARSRPTVPLLLFLLHYPKWPNHVYVFVEGHADCSFYLTFVRQFVLNHEEIHPYVCGGKDKVYEAHRMVMPRVRRGSAVMFFVDKDLSDVLPETYADAENIYVTDCYSIENYLVAEGMFVRVWEELLHFEGCLIGHEEFLAQFQEQLRRFHTLLRPATALIVWLWRREKRPNVSDVALGKILRISDELALEVRRQVLGEVWRMCGVHGVAPGPAEIQEIVDELSALDPKCYISGKFELWFFVAFLRKVVSVIKRNLEGAEGSLKTHIEISEANAVEVLAPRLPIPESLERFLKVNLRSRVAA